MTSPIGRGNMGRRGSGARVRHAIGRLDVGERLKTRGARTLRRMGDGPGQGSREATQSL